MKLLCLILSVTFVSIAQERLPSDGDSVLVRSGSTRRGSQMAGVREDTLRTYRLPEIIVTATRLERNPADIGRSVTVISRDEVANSLHNSVADVLSQQGGMYVVGARQNPGMLQSIFLRGAANNHIAVMIDDVRIMDPSSVNSALDASELSFTGFDRLEIVRGSHGTLYGSSAIGGVINVITRKEDTPGFHGEAEVKTGIFGRGTSALAENLLLNYTAPSGFYTNAEVNQARFRGLDATVDTIQSTTGFASRDKDGFDKRDVLGKIGYKGGVFEAYASYRRTDQKTDIDKGAFIDDGNSTVDFGRNLFTYGAQYRIDDSISLKYIGGYTDMKRVALDDSSVVDEMGNTDHTFSEGMWEGTSTTNELQGIVRFSGLDLVLGAGLQKETMNSRSYFFTRSSFGVFEFVTDLDSLNLHSSTKNLFAHFDLNGSLLGESLRPVSLTLGARSNHHSSFGSYLTYEINPSVRLSDGTLLYASLSTGFNAPSLYQLYSPERDFTTGITRGNPRLEPEKSSSMELGWKQAFGSDVRFSISYFQTVVENSIEYVYLWDKNVEVDQLGNDWLRNDFRGDTYLNVGQQTTSGVEVSFGVNLTKRLDVVGNLCLLKGSLKYRPSDISIAQTQGNRAQIFSTGAFVSADVHLDGLARRPSTANLSFLCTPLAELLLRLDIRYAGVTTDFVYDATLGPFGALGRTQVAEYTLVDLSQHVTLGKGFSLNAKVENLFDVNYAEINGFTTRPRSFYLSLNYRFRSSL